MSCSKKKSTWDVLISSNNQRVCKLLWGVILLMRYKKWTQVHKPYNPSPPGAYARDRDISSWWPLQTEDRHVGVQSLHFRTGEKRRSKPQVVSILTIAVVFTGLSIQIARFGRKSGGGGRLWEWCFRVKIKMRLSTLLSRSPSIVFYTERVFHLY